MNTDRPLAASVMALAISKSSPFFVVAMIVILVLIALIGIFKRLAEIARLVG